MQPRLTIIAAVATALLLSGCNKSRADTNKPPVIQALTASPAGPVIKPEQDVTLTLDFVDPDETDPDPQSFRFTWTVSALGITAPPDLSASLLVSDDNPGFWRAPEAEGTYRLRGRVCDRFDDCSEASLTLTVEKPNSAPRITASNVDNFNPMINQAVEINVTAVDDDEGDELNWEWEATKGSFVSREAGRAVWVGTQPGTATITVRVADQYDAEDTADFVIDVQEKPDP